MAEPLKNQFGPEVVKKISRMLGEASSSFQGTAFVRSVLRDYDELGLMDRARKIAQGMRDYLPQDYPKAARILLDSLGPTLERTTENGMAPFLYLPHVFFVADYGLEHFEVSMQAQYELTKRFTAEFSIRAYLEHHQKRTLAKLRSWTKDPSPHVRRLVSEGIRPRLPWAPRLSAFQRDPAPVLALLELLKDDDDLYVRRSVANCLNDIGKDHPMLLVETARKWMVRASDQRKWVLRHALRTAVKRGEPGALAVMGYGQTAKVALRQITIKPSRIKIGSAVVVSFELENRANVPQRVLVDLKVHFVKANGKANPKVFKVKEVSLDGKGSCVFQKRISTKEMTTRKHYPGTHRVEVVINGHVSPLGSFSLIAS